MNKHRNGLGLFGLAKSEPALRLMTQQQWQQVSVVLNLTERELQVIQYLFFGKTRQEIADRMEIKTRTVRHYMEQLHRKLQVCNRVGVVLRIIQVRDALVRGDLVVVDSSDSGRELMDSESPANSCNGSKNAEKPRI